MLRYSTLIHEGDMPGPVVVLVHGLAVSGKMWVEPENETLFAGLVPFRKLVADIDGIPPHEDRGTHSRPPLTRFAGLAFSPSRWDGDDPPASFWRVLTEAGYSVVTWSQREPKGPIALAVEEMHHVMEIVAERFPDRPVALIGHSRGGLIARKYLDEHPEARSKVAVYIGLGVPHRGSRLASLGIILSPVLLILRHMAQKEDEDSRASNEARTFISRLKTSLQSEGFGELVPDSPFIRGLQEGGYPGIRYVSIIGNAARQTKGYMLRYDDESYERTVNGYRHRAIPREWFTVPDTFAEKLPVLVPDEMVEGKGDGQVAAASAALPWADEEYTFPVTHAEMVVSKTVQRTVLDVLERMTSKKRAKS